MTFVQIPSLSIEMATTPVTLADWKDVMHGTIGVPNDDKTVPVECVSFREAEAFCHRMNEARDGYIYRLPTKEEWEYACKGGGPSVVYGEPLDIGWFRENSIWRVHPVGRKTPNGYGLYDMLGNVAEWTATRFAGNKRERVVCGRTSEEFAALLSKLHVGFENALCRKRLLGFRVVRQAQRKEDIHS